MLLEEEISYIFLEKIHICSVIRFLCSYISPISIHLVSVYSLDALISHENISYEVISSLVGACLKELYELSSSYYIYTDRNGVSSCNKRLLLEVNDASIVVHLDNTKSVDVILARCHILTYYCDVCTIAYMLFENLIVVQFVDSIT